MITTWTTCACVWQAKARRLEARTSLALSKMTTLASAVPVETDVNALGVAIGVAEKEAVDAAAIESAKTHLSASYKAQSEGGLEPLSRAEELRHEGFALIDPLRAALEEARNRGMRPPIDPPPVTAG